jgi:hypothetical protein
VGPRRLDIVSRVCCRLVAADTPLTSTSVLFALVLGAAWGSATADPPRPRPAADAKRPSTAATVKPRPTELEGSVKGPGGKPVEGARLFCRQAVGMSAGGPPPLTAKTDAEGRFRLELPLAAPAAIRVEARGLAAKTLERVRPGGAPLAIVLDKGRSIDVTVRDEAGQPAGGAYVEVSPGWDVPAWDPTAGRITAVTDVRGRARLDGIGEGLQDVSASFAGAHATRSGVRPGTGVSLVLRAGASIAGTVMDEHGRGVKNAIVRQSLEPDFWSGRSVVTDARGRFEIVGVEPGAHTLVAYEPEWAPAVVPGIEVTAQGHVDVPLVLTRGAAVAGRLVDAEERPVAGRVRVQELGGHAVPTSLGEILGANAGPDGRFRIAAVGPGAYTLAVTARGFASARAEVDVKERTPQVELGDVVLETGLSIRGRVSTRTGAPVAEATVSCTQSRNDFFTGWPTETRSEPDGRFTLAGLLPGVCEVFASAPGYARGRAKAEVGGKNVVLMLEAAGAITGVVVEEGNRPVDAYSVRLEPAEGSQGRSYREMQQRSVGSADGRFTLEDLSAGAYVVQVLVPDRAPVAVSGVRVGAGGTTDVGVIRAPRGGVVRGVVVDASGNGVVGASVQVTGPGQDFVTWSQMYATLTEPGGVFEVRGVPEGKTRVDASHPSFASGSTTVDVEPGKDAPEARIVLAQGGRIEGSARKRDGVPLAGYTVSVWSRTGAQGGSSSAVTRPDGTFAIEHVPTGPATVNLMTSSSPGVTVSMRTAQVDVREGEATPVDLVSQEILVAGRASRSGAPLAGLDIRLMAAHSSVMVSVSGAIGNVPAPPSGPERLHAVTRADGSFELIVDGPDRYYAQFHGADGRTSFPNREIEVPDTETYPLDLAFTGVPVSGVVVDKATSEPIAQAAVEASRRDDDKQVGLGGTSGLDGRFEFDADPGPYRVGARADGYALTTLDLEVGPDGVGDVRVELERGLGIEGRVVDGAGRGLSGISVSALGVLGPKDRETRMSGTRPDGTFTIDGLRPGRYTLCAGSEIAGYALRAGVAAGGRDVTLPVRPAGKVVVRVMTGDGRPVPESWSEITKVDGAEVSFAGSSRGPTDVNGVTELASPPGVVELTAHKEKRKGTARVTVGEGATTTVELRLSEPDDGSP